MGVRALHLLAAKTSATSTQPGSERVMALRDLTERLIERFPFLKQVMGDRPEIELPAFGVSLAFHLAMITVLGTIGLAAHQEAQIPQIQADMLDTTLPEFNRVEIQELNTDPSTPLARAEEASTAPVIGASMGNPVVLAASAATSASGAPAAISAKVDVRRPTDLPLPAMASTLGDIVEIKGNGAEHVGDVEGAVDRIAIELVRRLERGRTLVVWAFDSSGSLQVERERLSKHIDGVYSHIKELDRDKLAADGGLLTMVVAFGEGRKAMLNEPTADSATVISAIGEVPLDTTGVESTFQTVGEIVTKWAKYKDDKGNTYQTVVIVVTDEVGDDEPFLEEAIARANKSKVPIYVLGSAAMFGRIDGRMNYTDPKTKHTFYNVPVRQGPESVSLEQIRLPFWYDGPQYDFLDAGFGPYALSRMAGATGGIYFVTRLGAGNISFDPNAMREYRPDWTSRQRYEADLSKHPLRQAVLAAANVTHANKLPNQPALVFPPVDGPEFKDTMKENQALAARTEYTVDEALGPITSAVKSRDRETSRRWQAHYDLIRGRLLAVKIRCREYNWACAQMVKEAPKFTKPSSNAWRLVPDEEIHYSDKAKVAGDEARKLLTRVVEDHPGTPWALLAKRELKDPLGFKWVETTLPPRPKPRDMAAAKKAMPKGEMPKPPPVPKL